MKPMTYLALVSALVTVLLWFLVTWVLSGAAADLRGQAGWYFAVQRQDGHYAIRGPFSTQQGCEAVKGGTTALWSSPCFSYPVTHPAH